MSHRRFSLLLLGLLPLACIPSRRNPEPPPAEPPPPPPATFVPTAPPPPTTAPPPATTAPPPATTAARPPVRPNLRLPRPVTSKPPPATGQGCGSINVDGVVVPIDCFHKDYARIDGAPKAPVVALSGPVVEYVDHRNDKLEGPVRHQKSVGNGVAFALAGAIDQALIRNGGGFSPVSAMHLWARAPRPLLGPLFKASQGKGIASEATLPYNDTRSCAWAAPEANWACKPAKSEQPTTADVDAQPFARLVDAAEIDGSSSEALRGAIARNQDVLYVLRIDAEAWKSVVKSADAEPLLPDYAGTTAVHAVSLVGFALQDKKWFYLVKNSWGPGWGRDGYAWIEESTLKKNYIASYVVQATVFSGPTIGPAGPHACPPGQLPDSVSKQCAQACPDNSPRKNGACK